MQLPSPIVTVQVRSIAVGGAGVGEVVSQEVGSDLLGITAFVPLTAPGDVVRAAVKERKPRFINAELVSIEQPSDDRLPPECPVFGQCGGCELQHAAYGAQLRYKEDMVTGALRAARLPDEVIQSVRAVVPSSPYGYRRRIHLHVGRDGSVGFYRANSRSVVPSATCPISTAQINELLPTLQDFGRELEGKVSSILLEEDARSIIVVLKSPYDLGNAEREKILKLSRKYFENVVLFAAGVQVGAFGRQILELPLDREKRTMLHVPAGAFSQVNAEINTQLIDQALRTFPDLNGKKVFDLYSGAGNFALPFARSGATVIAVESEPRLVALGRQNAERCRVDRNLTFFESSVERFVSAPKGNFPGDLVIADPPRSGLGSIVPRLAAAPRFLLVSCHLPSFVRDVKALIESGMRVKFIQPFDMFAQTSYMEVLCALER